MSWFRKILLFRSYNYSKLIHIFYPFWMLHELGILLLLVTPEYYRDKHLAACRRKINWSFTKCSVQRFYYCVLLGNLQSLKFSKLQFFGTHASLQHRPVSIWIIWIHFLLIVWLRLLLCVGIRMEDKRTAIALAVIYVVSVRFAISTRLFYPKWIKG